MGAKHTATALNATRTFAADKVDSPRARSRRKSEVPVGAFDDRIPRLTSLLQCTAIAVCLMASPMMGLAS